MCRRIYKKETLLIASYRAAGRKSASGAELMGFYAVLSTFPLKRTTTSSAIDPPKEEEKLTLLPVRKSCSTTLVGPFDNGNRLYPVHLGQGRDLPNTAAPCLDWSLALMPCPPESSISIVMISVSQVNGGRRDARIRRL